MVVVVELAMTMLPIGCATGGVTWGYFGRVEETGVFVSRWLVLHCLTASLPQESTGDCNREPRP